MKKLLITLGCSYTEGMGCYGLLAAENAELKKIFNHTFPLRNYVDRERFQTHGWPHKLQKMLKYDHLINLGKGGSSNLFVLKRWMEALTEKNFSEEYEVVVLWMMTFFSRTTLYLNSILQNMGPGIGHDVHRIYYNEYIRQMSVYSPKDKDIALENLFCLNTINYICKLNGYKFLYINVDPYDAELLEMVGVSKELQKCNLNKLVPTFEIQNILYQPDYNNIAFCGHPNEEGYTLIANRMFNIIKIHHPAFLNEVVPEKFTMEYMGEPKKW
jgi:hypothetical protein